ncbi:mediator of RNA polymerase II transcription subunit 23 [Phlebotomus argentipes]|uniref:mediator of RNA polymerase II transcription subunit 23 n=1 Tax=Phlebotomus argentipes TaxID=94469 RepID=UPI0028932518|nr:mediator of RNA polymerase II transcription subunit 23 [Phlebotomus argentipes]
MKSSIVIVCHICGDVDCFINKPVFCAKMSNETQILSLIDDILKIDSNEDVFPGEEEDKSDAFQKKIGALFGGLTSEQKESTLRQYLVKAATQTNLSQLKLLLETLSFLVRENALPARLLCEQILGCEKLVFQNQNFWIESLNLLKASIASRRGSGGVDYKGVREIMRGCREKAQTFPKALNSSTLPQMLVLESIIEYIFDRNACLLPAYFIANEIQKTECPETHWKMARLMATFVEEFRNTAQMLTIIGHSQMLPIVEHFGYADHLINPWRLDRNTLKFTLKGILPYDTDLLQPQTGLLRFVLEQPYSKDMVCSILNLQKQHKQRCVALEEQLVWLVISAMERSEQETASTVFQTPDAAGQCDDKMSSVHWLWLHLSSQLIYFVLFQFANFPTIVMALHDKLATRTDLRKGRDHLMWVLLQFISGSIQRNPLSNFLPVLKLYDILYPEREPLSVPDFNRPYCTRQMAPTCIWIHLLKKAQTDQINIHRQIPKALKNHHEFLQELVTPSNPSVLSMGSDFRIALLCNAYSTNQDYFSRPMAALVDTILGNQKSGTGSSGSGSQQVPTVPLSMVILDSLTVHSKMSLIHSIVTHMMKHPQSKNAMPNVTNMAPALVETYSRLLVYTEIESLGIKGFLTQLLPTVFKSHAWGILYTLLEMFSYRMHHIQPHYRVQLLSHLHSLAAVPHTNQMQLHLCVESTALRLITGLGSAEVQPQISRYLSEPKTPSSLVSAESEELNRVLILTIARSMHITGIGNDPSSSWCRELLTGIMQNTPHSWASHTLHCFPPVLNEFFTQNTTPKENKQMLKKAVEEDYRNWTSMSNENDIIAHFSAAATPPLFLCLLFKMIYETDGISPVAYKILERIGARGLSVHLRKLSDYIVFEVQNSSVGAHVNKCVDTINDMIWKYHIVTIDRLVLCLALRTQEGNDAQVSFFIVQLVLLKSTDFRNRLQEFVKENSPEHWKQSNWHEKHLAFHQKYPEKFAPDESVTHPPLPVYFGNVCLRFLPVLDIVIHRLLEITPAGSTTHSPTPVILDHLGCLYKFHDRPITYLYNTLHYYERKLRDNPSMKRTLVGAVIGSLKDVRPANWALTEHYQMYLQKSETEAGQWKPELTYYISLLRRLIETIDGKHVFYTTDWRFNEFPNPAAHALYVTCVELLALPANPQRVANSLMDVICRGYTVIPPSQIHSWINAFGLVISNLPESYWSVMYDRLRDVLQSHHMKEWKLRYSPFDMFNFKTTQHAMLDKTYVFMLAMAQSVFHHFGIGQIATMPEYVKEKLKPIIATEHQLIYICHLVGPFLQRLDYERPRQVAEITAILYELVEKVDKSQGSAPLLYMDSICDLLYHIKYMFVGDKMKTELEAIIRRLRPSLQKRLRFITRMNVEEIGVEKAENVVANPANASTQNTSMPGQATASSQAPSVGVPQQRI